MKPAQLLILLLVVVLALLVALFGGFVGADPASGGGGNATPAAPSTDLEGPDPDSRRADLEGEADGVDPDARAAAAGPALDASGQTVTLRGRVVFPAAASADPDLTVYALTLPCRYQDFAASLEHPGHPEDPPDAVRLRAQIAGALVDRTRVGPDGRFEVAFPATERVGFLMVRGRYLYLPSTSQAEVTPDALVELAPAAGTWVKGEVSGPDGTPVAGTQVRVFGFSSSGTLGFGGRPDTFSGLVAAGADGRFEVHAVPAIEPYSWSVFCPALAGARGELGPLEPGAARDLPIRLAGGSRVSGAVVDRAGRPVSDAVVSAWLPGRLFGMDDELARRITVDERGRFELTGLPVGRVKVNADHPAMLDSTKQVIEVADGEEHKGVQLVLDQGREIQGRVRSESGAPQAGVDVSASFDYMRVSGPDFFNSQRGARARTTSDAEGRFTLAGLGAGPFVVEASDERPLAGGGEAVHWSARRDGVRPAGPELLLTLRPPLVIAGQVLDEEGSPVEVFTVVARQEVMGEFVGATIAYRRGSFVDQSGRFVLPGVEAGTWQVSAGGDGLVASEATEVVLPGGGEALALSVVRAASVAGEVFDAQGQLVVGATVRLDEGGVGWQVQQDPFSDELHATTDEQGEFLLTDLPPGKLALVAEAVGHASSATLNLEVDPGQVLEDVNLRLTRGGTLTGEVYTPEGDVARGWVVLAFKMPEFSQEATGTGSDGTFRMENVPPGGWMAIAMNPRSELEVTEQGLDVGAMMSQWKMTQANIREGETTHVVIGSAPENLVQVSGEVTLGGEPYAGALINFVPPGGRMYEQMVNASVGPDGSYAIDLDGAGAYIVSIQVVSGAAGQQNSIEYAVEIPAGVDEHRLDFALPLGRISGRVLGPDRQPAGGARVTLTYDGVVRSDSFFGGHYTEITTQADGTFDVQALRPGTYRLSAGGASLFSGALQNPFGRVTTGDLRLSQDEWMQGVDLRLPRPGTIDVTVLDATGQPLDQASVFVRDAQGRMLEPFSMVVTDGAGRCEYGGVAPGEVTVSARVGGLTCEESEPVSVPEGGRVAVTLRLEAGTLLQIVLRDEQGKEASGTVSVTDEQGRELTGMFGMADMQALFMEGQFSPYEHRLGPLPPGRYAVTAVIGGKQVEKSVRLRGEPEKRMALRVR